MNSLKPGALHRRIPELKHGSVTIVHDSPDMMTRLRAARDGQPLNEKVYTRLHIDGRLWMTDAEFDCWTNYPAVIQMRGDVLIAGLGLGMILPPVLKSKEVRSVTVLEISQDLIAAVGPMYKSKKLKIIHADCREWPVPKRAFDCIYLDIWQNVPNEDNLKEIKALKQRYRAGLRKGGWVRAWCENYAQRAARAAKRPRMDPFSAIGGRF